MKTIQTVPTIWKRPGKVAKAVTKLAVLATLAMGAAEASPVSFSFLSGGTYSGTGYTRSFSTTSSGITVTATGYSLSTLGGDFANAQVGRASGYGLWVCNQSEGLNCASPEHQIDNYNGWDFVLLQFSQAVDIESISIKTYSNADLDITYYLGSTANNLSLNGVNRTELAGLGFGSALNNDVNSAATSRTALLNGTSLVNSLLVGARIDGDWAKDYFKVTGLSVETVADVPEPSTYFLCGTALALMGVYHRRRASRA